jgi:translation elongation factor aEF-1 beta
MGDVVAKIRILPKDFSKMDELKQSLDFAQIMEEKPIAFGVSALEILVRVSDTGGGLDSIETRLSTNPRVSSYEILEIGRI